MKLRPKAQAAASVVMPAPPSVAAMRAASRCPLAAGPEDGLSMPAASLLSIRARPSSHLEADRELERTGVDRQGGLETEKASRWLREAWRNLTAPLICPNYRAGVGTCPRFKIGAVAVAS